MDGSEESRKAHTLSIGIAPTGAAATLGFIVCLIAMCVLLSFAGLWELSLLSAVFIIPFSVWLFKTNIATQKPHLIISSEGVACAIWGFETIPWKDIKAIRIGSLRIGSGTRADIMYVDVFDRRKYSKPLPATNKRIDSLLSRGSPKSLNFRGLDVTRDQLTTAVNFWLAERKRAASKLG